MQYEDVEPQRMDCDGDSTDVRMASDVLCRGGDGNTGKLSTVAAALT